MPQMMTPKERVEAVLYRKGADQVPFTTYEVMVVQCEVERQLRNEGLCIVSRTTGVFRTESPNVKEVSCHYCENGHNMVRREVETPFGRLSELKRLVDLDAPSKVTGWDQERLFKSPDDYKAIEFMIRDRIHIPDYGPIATAMKQGGGDVLFRGTIGYEPFQEIIIRIMGLENFAVEWAENRDEVLNLYRALVDDRRKIYPIAAQSPVSHFNYGGNVVSEIVGRTNFEKYLLPDYQECAEVLHKSGKLVGTHLDANNRLIAPLVAKTGLDYIEAFSPVPASDMTLREALDAWPSMIIWMHFPSSLHLEDATIIEASMLEYLEDAWPCDRLIVGITEDIPNDHWQKSMSAISRVLRKYGKLPMKTRNRFSVRSA